MPGFLDRKLLLTCTVGLLPFVVIALFTEARAWALLLLVAMVALTVFAGSGGEERQPDLDDTRRFLRAHLNGLGFTSAFSLDKLQHRLAMGSSSDCANIHFEGVLEITSPLFQTTVPPSDRFGAFTPRRVAALTAIAEQLAPAIAALPGVKFPPMPADPYTRQFITARTAASWTLPFSGNARATYSPQLGWSYALTTEPREFGLLARTGKPATAFPEAIDPDSASGREWIHETIDAWTMFEAELGRLRAAADEQRTLRSQEAVAEFFAACKTGTRFHGSGETITQTNAPLPFVLEVESVDAPRRRLTFTLRRDVHAGAARPFTATIEHDSISGLVHLVASTTAAQSIPAGGPLLSAATGFELELVWSPLSPTRLDGRGADFSFSFDSTAPAFTALHRPGHDRDRAVWKAIAPGRTYRGTFAADGRDESFTLTFATSAPTGPAFARLVCDAWTAPYDVTRCSSRDGPTPYDLMLECVSVPVAVGEAGTDMAGDPWSRIFLQVDDTGLLGVAECAGQSIPLTFAA